MGRRFDRHRFLNTVGAVLYRAGRLQDAIRRFDEKVRIRLSRGAEDPQDWAFLAMAHHRLGHHDDARRWLVRLRTRQRSASAAQFWDEREIYLLRSEAEAVVPYDPIFPADPFAALSSRPYIGQ